MNESEGRRPKVTVITGYYNRGYALDKTIDSIMAQSFTDFEFIVFNDHSTDETEEKLKIIESRYNDSRLILVNHEKNKGFVQGMIDAIAISKGEYICVQGSGDVSHTDRLKYQVKLLDQRTDVGVVGCFYENFVESENVTRVREKSADDMGFDELLAANVFSHGEVIFRRSVYDLVGGYRSDFVNCQDYDLWLRMAKLSRLATVPKVLYSRFVRYDGVSYKPDSFLKQTRYHFLCQDLAEEDDSMQKEVLAIVRSKGIDAYMGLNSLRVQKRIIKASLRSLVWGEHHAATELVKKGIVNPIAKVLLLIFVKIYSSPLVRPIRSVVNKKLGVS